MAGRFCPACGKQVTNEATACIWCGANLQSPAAAPFTGVPVTNSMAVGSVICGVLFFFFPAAVAAIVLGHISSKEIRRSNGRQTGGGLAQAGLVLGYLGVALIPLMLLIAAIAIPNLLRSRMAANEASAIGSLRTYNVALIAYATQCAQGSFPVTVTKLGPGGNDCEHAGTVDEFLAADQAVKMGYRFSYTPGPADEQGRVATYTITADPANPSSSGFRHFYTDQTDIIRVSTGSPADADSPPLR